MKAVVKEADAPGIAVRDVAEPAVGSGEALVRMELCGICGSDVATYLWQPHKRQLASRLPMILGHEGVGRVVAVGDGVTDLGVGDRVVTEPIIACGNCAMCRIGRPNICLRSRMLGTDLPGAMAPWAALPQRALVRIPEELPNEQAALLEVGGTAMRAVERADGILAQHCAIVGPGAIGLLLLQILRAGGAASVDVFGTARSPLKLEMAQQLGADIATVLPPEDADNDFRGRYGVVFEAAGSTTALAGAARLVGPGGRIVAIGSYDEPVDLRMYTNVRSKEADIVTTRGRVGATWEKVIRLTASGALDLACLRPVEVSIEDAPEAFARMAAGDVAKVSIRCC